MFAWPLRLIVLLTAASDVRMPGLHSGQRGLSVTKERGKPLKATSFFFALFVFPYTVQRSLRSRRGIPFL